MTERDWTPADAADAEDDRRDREWWRKREADDEATRATMDSNLSPGITNNTSTFTTPRSGRRDPMSVTGEDIARIVYEAMRRADGDEPWPSFDDNLKSIARVNGANAYYFEAVKAGEEILALSHRVDGPSGEDRERVAEIVWNSMIDRQDPPGTKDALKAADDIFQALRRLLGGGATDRRVLVADAVGCACPRCFQPIHGQHAENCSTPRLASLPVGGDRAVPDGWRLVPVEPTPEMDRAGANTFGGQGDNADARYECAVMYRAMLSSSPEAVK